MIRERFISVIICSVLSSLLTDCGLAIASATQLDFTSEPTLAPSLGNRTVQDSRSQLGHTNYYKSLKPNIAVAQPQPQLDNNDRLRDEGSSRKIDRNFSLAAMAIISAVSLLLLWILFQEPQATADPATEGDNDLKLITEEEKQAQTLPPLNILETKSNTDGAEETVTTESDYATASIEWLIEKYQATVENEKTSQPIPIDCQIIDIDVVAELIQDLQHSNRRLRRKAIWELAELGDTRSIKPLVDMMPNVSSLDKSLISNAITQIVHRSFQSVNHRLFANLQHKNSQIKKNAINDLSDLYLFIAPVTKKLVQMQLDKDPEVSQTAVQALRRLNISSCFEPVRDYRDRHSNLIAKKAQTNLRLIRDLPAEIDAES